MTDLTYYREKEQDRWVALDEREIRTLRRKIATDTCKRVLKSDVQDVLWSDTSILVHPVRDYSNALPPWDGRDRVAELAGYVVADDGEGACTLRSICVVKEERRKGNGSLLMENLFFLFAPKCSLMRAEASGELEPFFTKLGFVRAGEGHAGRLAMERTLKTGCACCEKEKAERGEGV